MTPNDSTPSPDQLEEVFNSIDAVEVGMARDLLESSGMECFVFDAFCWKAPGWNVSSSMPAHR